jgi:sugar phosphate isomerase/epimerase
MKLSIVLSLQPTRFASLAYQGKTEVHLQRIKKLGYDGVELAIRDPSLLEWNQLEESIKNLGLKMPAIGTGQAYIEEGLRFSSPSEDIRKQAIERIRLHIFLAKRFKAGVIIGLIRGKVEENEHLRKGFDWMLDSMKACCEIAEKEGVPLWLEPLNRYETNLINTIEEGIALLSQIGSKRLGLLPDTFHMNIEEPVIEESLRKASPYYQHLHLADSNRWPPGSGHIDFKSILHILNEIGYSGLLSIECLPKPDPDEAARGAMDYLKKIAMP